MGKEFVSGPWAAIARPALWGTLWAALAIGSLYLRNEMSAQLLVWPPSAVGVACLLVTPRGEWLPMLVALAVANLVTGYWVELPLVMNLVIALANLVEPLIIVSIVRWRRPEESRRPLKLGDLVTLFGASLLGASVAAAVAHPVRTQQTPIDFAWWILAVTLGVLIVMPLILLLRNWLLSCWGEQGPSDMQPASLVGAAVSFIGMLVLAQVVLHVSEPPLTSLVVVAMVVFVVRYGQIAMPAGVLAFALVAIQVSLNGNTPAPFLDYRPAVAAFALQLFMLLLMAMALPLAAMLIARDRMQSLLEKRNAKMRESLTMLSMAEQIAKIGRWRFEPATDRQYWSPEMYRMHGMDPHQHSDPGNVRSMLPDGGKRLFGMLVEHKETRAPYNFEYEILRRDGERHILKMHANNEFDDNGRLRAMFGVVLDVTEHHRQQEAIDRERRRAMLLAAEAQVLANTDPLTKLANRRRTLSQLKNSISLCEKQEGRKLAVITFDIDHFKRINDTLGHQAGDDVLVRVADIAREQMRADDLLGRTGGEEFVWILPFASAAIAERASERLRRAIESGSGAGGLPGVTVSVGFATWRPGDDVQRLLARADQALYEAKHGGRNRVRRAA